MYLINTLLVLRKLTHLTLPPPCVTATGFFRAKTGPVDVARSGGPLTRIKPRASRV
jgi:hypothetical protein